MKYIGNKTRLLPFIEECLIAEEIEYNNVSVIDLFAGTGSVSKFFKAHGCIIKTCDFMTYSIAEQYRTIFFDTEPVFNELEEVIGDEGSLKNVLEYLNNLPEISGYFFENFAPSGACQRQYFTNNNARKIDAIRQCLNNWQPLLSFEKYMFLIGILMNAADHVSNTAGTYGAYLKIWRPTAQKDIILTSPEFINIGNVEIYQDNVNNFVKNLDPVNIVYIDPPYNSRQYAPNFHLLESIVVYDQQQLTTKTGIRDYKHQNSKYCNKRLAEQEFSDLISNINAENIIMSYSNEGLLSEEKIVEILSTKGEVTVYRNAYRRFKTNSWTNKSTGLYELLFICKSNYQY